MPGESRVNSIKKNKKRWIIGGIVAILVLIILLIIIVIIVKTGLKDATDPDCPKNPSSWTEMACCRRSCSKGWKSRPLILLSLDGFRADYLSRNLTPSIQNLINCGAHAPFMFPSYPTITFPNHYSIVTGLYPESHGIIDNRMWDSMITNSSNRNFSINKDMRPTYWTPYNKSLTFQKRANTVVEWLLYPDEKRPDFITMYYNQPDTDGHKFGPYAPELNEQLKLVDSNVSYLMQKLFDNDLLNCVDLIIVADHGMEHTDQKNFMSAQSRFNVDVKNVEVFGGPVGRIHVENSSYKPEEIFEKLVCINNYSTVYYRNEVPRRLHLSLTHRIGDVVIYMENRYMFTKYVKGDYFQNGSSHAFDPGQHGYDNKFHSMQALFLAYGPSFKKAFTAIPFQNVELYTLFSDLLSIPLDKRAPTNGTPGVLDQILLKPPERNQPIFQRMSICPFQSSGLQTCGNCNFLSNDSCKHTFSSVHVQNLHVASTVCQSTTCDYASIYYANLSMPVVVQAQISSPSKMTTNDQIGCSRIEKTISCNVVSDRLSTLKSLNASMYSLLDFDAATSAAATLWYAKVPMYDGFYQGAWKWTQDLTMNYTTTYQKVIVFAGPIFDYDYNGLADNPETIWKHEVNNIPIPTHFYQILLRCDVNFDQNGLCNGNPYVLSFILPHISRPRNYCQTPEDYLYKNTARIRDIELLTGVQFFTNWEFYTAIRLRTKINDQLWN